jgi:hypothetical protein
MQDESKLVMFHKPAKKQLLILGITTNVHSPSLWPHQPRDEKTTATSTVASRALEERVRARYLAPELRDSIISCFNEARDSTTTLSRASTHREA